MNMKKAGLNTNISRCKNNLPDAFRGINELLEPINKDRVFLKKAHLCREYLREYLLQEIKGRERRKIGFVVRNKRL